MNYPPLTLNFSNRLEFLFVGMSEHIYKNRTSPFDKIIIIVPSIAMKNWVMNQAACLYKIAFGFEVVLLNEAISKLSSQKTFQTIPKKVELAVQIEFELAKMQEHPFTLVSEKKRASLCLELAEVYLQYGEFAEDALSSWKNDSVLDWQRELWERIFHPESSWTPLYNYLTHLDISSTQKTQVHLFGMSFLSAVKQNFFEKLNASVPVNFWALSPSRMFICDLKSHKEQVFLTKRLQNQGKNQAQIFELQNYLEEGNPLLGNNGRLGRKWREMLENSAAITFEMYALSEAIVSDGRFDDFLVDELQVIPQDGALTLLDAIQADLTLLVTRNEPLEIDGHDDSIQIHFAPSRMREVEALYETLLNACCSCNVMPKDIIVMAPNLEKYIPFIKMVFNKSSSKLPFEILERTCFGSSSYVDTFFHLIELESSKWDIDCLFEVLQSPHFTNKKGLSYEELAAIKEIFSEEGVHFGINLEHRESFFKKKTIDQTAQGSWQGGIERLVQSLIYNYLDEASLTDPFISRSIRGQTAELLSRFLDVFQDLFSHLESIGRENVHSMVFWAEFLIQTLDTYMNAPKDEEARDELKRLFRILTEGKMASGLESISASSFFVYLKELLSQEALNYRTQNLQAVSFCPLLPMRAIPAEVIVLLGVNNEIFPQILRKNPLFLAKTKNYIPSALDFDRYLFLESLLSARKKWILSCIETENDSPSCLIQEVLDYLDANFRIMGKIPSQLVVHEHPEISFDSKYFLGETAIKSTSLKGYRSACILQKEPSFEEMIIDPPLNTSKMDLSFLSSHMTLSELKSLSSHPIRYHLNQVHGVYLQNEEKAHSSMEEFIEERLWESEWLKKALHYPIEEVIAFAEKLGKLPHAPFKEGAKIRLRKNLEGWKKNLLERGIALNEIFEIEFSYNCQKITEISPYKWQIPAQEIIYQGKKIVITGTLPYVSKAGYLSLREPKCETLVSMLPELLLLKSVPEKIAKPNVIFLKKNKEMEFKQISWDAALDNYVRSFHQIVPHTPSWIPSFLSSNPDKLKKAIEGNEYSKEDPYLKWAFAKGALIDCQKLMNDWQEETCRLFGYCNEDI